MSLLKKLVNRGGAIMREWHTLEGMDESSRRMVAELSAATIVNLCGKTMESWTIQEREEKVNAIRIALISAFQIGRNISPTKAKSRNRNPLD